MMPNTKLAKQVILAWHQQISGDIVVMNKPNWYLFAKRAELDQTRQIIAFILNVRPPNGCEGRVLSEALQ
jgi:hypothetical protein